MVRVAGLLLAVTVCPAALAAEPVAYPRPELLVEPAQLEAMLNDTETDLVVLHAASPSVYFNLRVPGAVLVDVSEWKSAFGDGSDTAAWSDRISAAGVGPQTRVVVYDNGEHPHAQAARVWWILKYWGVDQAALLNGGLAAWLAHAGPARPGAARDPEPGGFRAEPQPDRLATREEVLGASADSGAGVCFVDTRSGAEVAEGMIPKALHAEWLGFMDPATGRFRSAAELRERLGALGFDPQRPAVCYCRTGGRAAVVAFAMELMGGERVANYWGSWNDWSQRPGAPLAPPPMATPAR